MSISEAQDYIQKYHNGCLLSQKDWEKYECALNVVKNAIIAGYRLYWGRPGCQQPMKRHKDCKEKRSMQHSS